MKCDLCANDAVIRMESRSFCLDCFNGLTLQAMGFDEYPDYEKQIEVVDNAGGRHCFQITYMIFSDRTVWRAEEENGEYLFEQPSVTGEDQTRALMCLYQKVLQGVGYSTLQKYVGPYHATNAIDCEDGQYGIKSKGNIRILAEEDGRLILVIDGRRITGEEFIKTLSTFEGFTMMYQMEDLSGQSITEKTALRVETVDFRKLYDDFEKSLYGYLDNGDFLSCKDESALNSALFERLDDFEFAVEHGDREQAVIFADKMEERLVSIDTDADDFPGFFLSQIDRILRENLLL